MMIRSMQIVNGRQRPSVTALLSQLSDIQDQLVKSQDFAQVSQGASSVMAYIACPQLSGRLVELENDYRLMRDFMLNGYQDSQRPVLYKRLLRQLASLLRNVETEVKKTYDPYFSSLAKASSGDAGIDCASIRQRLVKHVQDVAMLSLEVESHRQERARVLYDAHFAYVRNLFNAIVVSYQWNEEVARDMALLLVSPTIDVLDAQTLVSAVTLATLGTPDPYKVMALVQIYAKAEDEWVRQRALVGWAFAIGQVEYQLFPEVLEQIGSLLDNEQVRKEVLQLLKQVIYCLNATRDQETLQKDILPTIMRNQEYDMTRFGIKEKAENPMEDILHPDAEDKKMELLEKSFKKISDMQKNGSDIYFGGFSQMKRFSFFYTLSNWFTPFYMEHPQLRHLSSQLLESSFMRRLMSQGPFCDSDKYSFALGMSSVYNNLPDNIRGMMENGELQGGVPDNEGVTSTRVFIRRSYLQDLFRFFKLSDDRGKFSNPFDSDGEKTLLSVTVLREKLLAEVRNLEVFLLKQKRFTMLSRLLEAHYDPENIGDLRMKAMVCSHFKDYEKAELVYGHMLEQTPDDELALRGMAQACFYQGKYMLAQQHYQALLRAHPERRNYALFLAISQINSGQAEEASRLLFKLNYNYPDDQNVKRALAWAQMWMKKLQQAHKIYAELLSSSDAMSTDLLNAGYCHFFEGKVKDAVCLISRSLNKGSSQETKEKGIREEVNQDKALFDSYGIPEADRKILCDLVDESLAN